MIVIIKPYVSLHMRVSLRHETALLLHTWSENKRFSLLFLCKTNTCTCFFTFLMCSLSRIINIGLNCWFNAVLDCNDLYTNVCSYQCGSVAEDVPTTYQNHQSALKHRRVMLGLRKHLNVSKKLLIWMPKCENVGEDKRNNIW